MDDIRVLDKPTYDLTIDSELIPVVDLPEPLGEIFYKESITE